ncbi:hypothetical protein PHMEG_00028007, partial [Phytophthora megakarya]
AELKAVREQRRIRQQRYRDNQKQKMNGLEYDCWQLRHQIQWLKQDNLLYMVSAKENAWAVAAQYFQVVQQNLLSPSGNFSAALHFLRKILSSRVDSNVLASSWRIFGFLFPGSEVCLQRLDQISSDILVATTSTKITITGSTLQTTFSHLTTNATGENPVRLQLACKLLGQSFVLRGSVRFVWDNEICRFVDLHSQADMIPSFLQMLGNIEDVAKVFSKALVTPDCNVAIERISPSIVHAACDTVRDNRA